MSKTWDVTSAASGNPLTEDEPQNATDLLASHRALVIRVNRYKEVITQRDENAIAGNKIINSLRGRIERLEACLLRGAAGKHIYYNRLMHLYQPFLVKMLR